MKEELKNMDDVLRRSLPSAARDGKESDGERVFRLLAAKGMKNTARAIWRGDQPRDARARFLVAAAAAIGAGFVIVTLVFLPFLRQLISPPSVFAVVETINGSVYRVAGDKTEPVRVGDRIAANIPLLTYVGAVAVLKLPDGAKIEIHQGSELTLEKAKDGVRIRLNEGSVQ